MNENAIISKAMSLLGKRTSKLKARTSAENLKKAKPAGWHNGKKRKLTTENAVKLIIAAVLITGGVFSYAVGDKSERDVYGPPQPEYFDNHVSNDAQFVTINGQRLQRWDWRETREPSLEIVP